MKTRIIVITLTLAFTSLAVQAQGNGKGNGPPNAVQDVNVVNSPDVQVTNSPDVNVVSLPPAPSIVACTLDAGSNSSGNPHAAAGFSGPQTAIVCPPGVERINVQRIAFSPDYSFSAQTVKFRATVGFSSGIIFDPAGFLAMVTDGSPSEPVAQTFVLDTTDSSLSIYALITIFSGLENVPVSRNGVIFFIGEPLP